MLFLSWLGCAADCSELAFADHGVVGQGTAQTLEVRRQDASVPMDGRLERTGAGFVWTPAVPWDPRGTYVAQCGDETAVRDAVEQSPQQVPELLSIGPDTERIPANHLKFTLRFSERMRGGPELWDSVHLIDGDAPVPLAFREHPLWRDDQRQLTLLLHPGRQKTDIPFAVDLAPILVPGQVVRVVVEGLRSFDGGALARTERAYTVVDADRTRPDPAQWRLTVHATGAQLQFDEPMDAQIAADVLELVGPQGAVDGAWRLDSGDTRAVLDADLGPGTYTLAVSPELLDLAGNSPWRLFDGHQQEVELPQDAVPSSLTAELAE